MRQNAKIRKKARHLDSSHREHSHRCFYNGVGGLDQAIVPIWIKRLRQLAAFQAVLFRTGAHAGLRRGRHRFDPLRGRKRQSGLVSLEKEELVFKAGKKIRQDLQE